MYLIGPISGFSFHFLSYFHIQPHWPSLNFPVVEFQLLHLNFYRDGSERECTPRFLNCNRILVLKWYLLSKINLIFSLKCQAMLKKESKCLPHPFCLIAMDCISRRREFSHSVQENIPSHHTMVKISLCYKIVVENPETYFIHSKSTIEGLLCFSSLYFLKY